jgi:hypothetical protein
VKQWKASFSGDERGIVERVARLYCSKSNFHVS